MDEFLSKLENPGAEYRSLPFWSWNDELDPDTLRWQIGEMAKAGVGGYFMHARSGLKTTYLGKPWFDCIEVGLAEGRKKGLRPWVYDEEGWPSGFAGGKVTQKGDRFYARGLRMKLLDAPPETEDAATLGLFAHRDGFREIAPASKADRAKAWDGYIEMSHSCSQYYVDVLNKDVIAQFIASTHEEYFSRFGSGMPEGFFTDEPRLSEGPIPWSYVLPKEFLDRHGYDVMDHLPALYLECEGYERVRSDFWSTVSELFVAAYMKQIYDWCESHGVKLTGHMMMEESLYSQMTGTSGSMPFYEYMHMPGVDSLRRSINDPRIPKQVSSMAEQLGKKFVISESFALAGWDMSFAEMRWIVNWQFVNGVNMICQHLQAYSLKGFRKRDYPPSLFYQQTWWSEYNRFNDYLARLTAILTDGDKLVDVLLVHPMHSGWIAYNGKNTDAIKRLDAEFIRATTTLSGLHVDYHLGDETFVKDNAEIRGGLLSVGKYSYRAVVVPSVITLDSSTVDLLGRLADKGMPVLALGDLPSLVGGKKDGRLAVLNGKMIPAKDGQSILTALRPVLSNPVSIRESGAEIADIHACMRRTATHRILFLVNNSQSAAHRATVSVGGSYSVEAVDLENVGSAAVASVHKNGETEFEAEVLPMQSIVFRLTESRGTEASSSAEASGAAGENGAEETVSPDLASGPWKIDAIDDNALTLDRCEYRIDEGPWCEPMPVILLMKKLLALKRPCDIEMRFCFELDVEPGRISGFAAAIEQPELYDISVNGQDIAGRNSHGPGNGGIPAVGDSCWFRDRSFRKLDIRRFVRRGQNSITLKTRFRQSDHVYETLFGTNIYETELNKLTYDMELESIYVIGDFGVYADRPLVPGERNSLRTEGTLSIGEMPGTLSHGCFTAQGLLFFSGKMKISRSVRQDGIAGKKVMLDFGNPRVALLRVTVNGTEAKTFMWAPYSIDIAPFAREGDNEIVLEIWSSNRNLLGPHHHANGELLSLGPKSFEGVYNWCDRKTEADEMNRSLTNVSFWDDAYTFVRFGF